MRNYGSIPEPDEHSPLLDVEGGRIDPDKDEDQLHEEEPIDKILLKVIQRGSLSLAKSILGYSLVIFAGLVFTAANVIQKIIAPDLEFWHLMLLRAIAQIVVMLLASLYKRVNIFGPNGSRIRMGLQGLLGGVLLLCIFIAIKDIPLGNSSAIFFCTPVFTFIFAIPMLRERMGLYRIMISLLMLSGVVLITRPPFLFKPDVIPCHHHHKNGTHEDYHHECKDEPVGFSAVGYLCAISVPFLSAVVSILTRQLKHVPASVLMLWFGGGTLIIGLGGVGLHHEFYNLFSLTLDRWIYTTLIIALGILGNVSYTFAMRWVSPSKANVFRSFEVILNYMLQLFLEHDTLFHFSNVVGICFLLLAVFSTGFEYEVMNRYKNKFKFL